jgi:hypothetical protein
MKVQHVMFPIWEMELTIDRVGGHENFVVVKFSGRLRRVDVW